MIVYFIEKDGTKKRLNGSETIIMDTKGILFEVSSVEIIPKGCSYIIVHGNKTYFQNGTIDGSGVENLIGISEVDYTIQYTKDVPAPKVSTSKKWKDIESQYEDDDLSECRVKASPRFSDDVMNVIFSVTLKRSPKYFVKCFQHQDKKPSAVVYPKSGMLKCNSSSCQNPLLKWPYSYFELKKYYSNIGVSKGVVIIKGVTS